MNDRVIMLVAMALTLALTVAGVLRVASGPTLDGVVLLGLGLLCALLGVQAARRERRRHGR